MGDEKCCPVFKTLVRLYLFLENVTSMANMIECMSFQELHVKISWLFDFWYFFILHEIKS